MRRPAPRFPRRAPLAVPLALIIGAVAACPTPDEASLNGGGDAFVGTRASAGRASEGPIGISDAVMVLPPGGGPAAAYMTIGLVTGVDTLLHAELEDGRRLGIHGSSGMDARVRMSDIGPVPLTQGEALRLHPGEAHIMIDSFERAPAPGDPVPLLLHFARAGKVQVDALVVRYDQLDSIFAGAGVREARAGH